MSALTWVLLTMCGVAVLLAIPVVIYRIRSCRAAEDFRRKQARAARYSAD